MDCIGIVRFSVLSTDYNKFQHWVGQPFEEYASIVLSEERLRSRFQLFERVTLPSFDNQTDKSFSLLIAAPRLLPEHWKSRLSAIAAEREYVHIHYAHEDGFRLAKLSPLIFGLVKGNLFSTFRIDDDDAVVETFVERLRRHNKRRFIGYGVSFSSGFYLDLSPASTAVALTPKDLINTGAGLAFVSSKEKPKMIFEVSEGHLNFHKRRPVVIDGRQPSFLVLNHEFNDTKGERHASQHDLVPEVAQQRLLEQGFHIDLVGLMNERAKASTLGPSG